MARSSDLTAKVSTRLAAAERLLSSAAMVGDAEDHRYWRSSRDLWVSGTVRDLGIIDAETAATFRRAATPSAGEGTIAEDLPVELEAIRSGMAVLLATRSGTDQAS
jgi:hypothetical protein